MARMDRRILENKQKISKLYGKSLHLHLPIMAYKRRLFYFPGMISLIGLFLFLSWNKEKFKEKKIYFLDLRVPRLDKEHPAKIFLSTEIALYNLFRNKKKIKVTLNSDPTTDQKILDFVRLEARGAGGLRYWLAFFISEKYLSADFR